MNRLFGILLIGILLGAATGCTRHAREAEENASVAADSLIHVSAESLRNGDIVVEPIVARALADTLLLNGEIQPNPLSVAHVSTRAAGTIQNVRVVVGDQVRRGQLLGTVFSPEFLAAVGDYLLAHERAEAVATGRSPDAASLQSVAQSSRRRLELLGAPSSLIERLQTSHEAVNELPLFSPSAGVITEVEAAPGKHVEAGTDLFGITNLSSVWAVAHAYERDLGRLHIGQPAEIFTSAFPGRTFVGKVASLQGAVDEATRTLEVRLDVANSGLALRPGMFVDARIATGTRREALVLGEGAVQDVGGSKAVFVAHADTAFVARPVTIRPLGGNLLEITTGLRAGERVATTGAFLLKSQALKGELGEE